MFTAYYIYTACGGSFKLIRIYVRIDYVYAIDFD